MAEYVTGEDLRCSIALATSSAASAAFTLYSIKKYTAKEKRPRLEVPNSEGKLGNPNLPNARAPGQMSATYGERSVEVTIEEATLDMDANIFGTPVQLSQNVWIWVKIFPDVLDTDYHLFHLLVDEFTAEGEVGQYQPISFKGETDGLFAWYGDSKAGL